jgi:hypothetical protein
MMMMMMMMMKKMMMKKIITLIPNEFFSFFRVFSVYFSRQIYRFFHLIHITIDLTHSQYIYVFIGNLRNKEREREEIVRTEREIILNRMNVKEFEQHSSSVLRPTEKLIKKIKIKKMREKKVKKKKKSK